MFDGVCCLMVFVEFDGLMVFDGVCCCLMVFVEFDGLMVYVWGLMVFVEV
ncbi:hypothetical protein QTP70_011314 [Hemibagrus guttatus]|uniref:Uncharacterized protein n=1 Tax=Hemibagrus guttatus TaxID=175788 RepID=A0AAE0QKX9_9TELE|nr:hypothetical protein QTP70_011314 [Hemibagrus guttatus]